MTRDDAWRLAQRYVANANTLKHMLATEAVMAVLARRLGEDENLWRLTGLLHDLDYETTKDAPDDHGRVTRDILAPYGVPPEALNAILAHNQLKPAETTLERTLLAVDPTTGFIVAAALMHPSKKLSACDVPFLKKRFKEKRFAAGANREQMAGCVAVGLEIDDFLGSCLAGMTAIATELGL